MGSHRPTLPQLLAVLFLIPFIIQIVFVVLPGFGSFVVLSGSMEPVIQTGSLVYVHDSDDYGRGDIITFTVGDETVTHRIIDETPEGFVTKGETQEADSWRVSESQIRGESLGSIPLYGYLLRPFSSQGIGLWGIVAGVVILLIVGRELLTDSATDLQQGENS